MANYLLQEDGISKILLEEQVSPGDAFLLEINTLQAFDDCLITVDLLTFSNLALGVRILGTIDLAPQFLGTLSVPQMVATGDDRFADLYPFVGGTLFVLRAGNHALPIRDHLRGSVDLYPELGGVVYAYPYQTIDRVVARTAAVFDAPMVTSSGQAIVHFQIPGQIAVLADSAKAPWLTDGVWQLVADGLLEVRRSRVPHYFDSDGTPVDFTPIPARPQLLAVYDPDNSQILVGRNVDDDLAQRITGEMLTPLAGGLLVTQVVADAKGIAAFPVVIPSGRSAQFVFSIVDGTHSDAVITCVGV